VVPLRSLTGRRRVTIRFVPFYTPQNAAREANMRAVRGQQYKNEMQNYKSGYRSTLPNY
jgi:hypothetical protein